MTVPVKIKHSGKTYDVEIDLNDDGITLKSQLFTLTGVPPEKQRLIIKGKTVTDEASLGDFKIQPNMTLILFGTPGALPKPPVEQPKFAEDMTDQQLAAVTKEPAGLVNCIHTCYANSMLQAMKTVPEIQQALASHQNQGDFLGQLKTLFAGMNRTTQAYMPLAFITSLRTRFPQFDERDEHGQYKEQDAEEAWSQCLALVRQQYEVVDKCFKGEFECQLVPPNKEEETRVTFEDFLKLDCHISITTNFLKDGLLNGLTEKIEKHSPSLNQNAEYVLTKRITRLPKFLTVHFMRFFWRRDTQKKSKILRKVTFPFVFDVTELCSPDLRKKIVPARDRYHEAEKEIQELSRAAKRMKLSNDNTSSENKEGSIDEDSDKVKTIRQSVREALDPELANDPTCNPTGLYEATAIISHKGMSADTGHYQCFTKHETEPGKWWKFNDEKVTIVDESKIESLAGGGESDSALIVLYKALKIE